MSIDENYLFHALTRWNYFPNQKSRGEEMPPVFTSRQFTPHVAQRLLTENPRKDGYDQIEYYATRYNNVARLLAIPHPVAYAHLVSCICLNWSKLNYICENENSLIRPEEHPDGRILIMDYEEPLGDTNRKINTSFGKKFRVHTDITNCFPSIYSHAIPWATVGLVEAKRNKHDRTKWYNQLDTCQRNLKRGETQGVAIGPGTSNIVSEAILAKVDEVIRRKYTYYRYIDDYTCYCETYEEGQTFLRDLNDELRKYKLSLNLKKTEIVDLPAPTDSDWIVELSTRMPAGIPSDPLKKNKQYGATEALRFIDFAVQLKKKTPDGSVLKFAVKSIIYQLEEHAVQPVLEYLLNLSRFYPLLLPLLDSCFAHPAINSASYQRHLNVILIDNANNRRSDGMCWALYFLIQNKLDIFPQAVEKVIESRDCMAILLLHLASRSEVEVAAFVASIDADVYELDRYWVLLYQRFIDGKTPNPYSDEKCFEILKQEQVSFVPKADSESPSEIALISAGFGFIDETITQVPENRDSNDL